MIFVSLTGLALLFYLKKRRRSGLLVTLIGFLFLVLVWAVWVP